MSLPSSVRWRYYRTSKWYCGFISNSPLFFFELSAQQRVSFPALTIPWWQAGRLLYKRWVISSKCFLVLLPWEPSLDSSRLSYPDFVCVFLWIYIHVFTFSLKVFKFLNSLTSFLNTLTWGRLLHWSLAWWSSLRTYPMAWQKASNFLVRAHLRLTDWLFFFCSFFFIPCWPRHPTCFSLPTGIMSILFAGIVMSHYTHHNLSPVTQILMQQTLRTMAFMCGQ